MSDTTIPEYDFQLDRIKGERREPPKADTLYSAARAWVHDSTAARSLEDAAARLVQFGWLGPPVREGYNPLLDDDLRGYTDSLGMFRDSRSPEETAYLKQRIDELRERDRDLSDMPGLMRFMVGALTLESLATWRLNTVMRGRSMLQGASQSAIATGAVAGGITGMMIAGDEGQVPGSMKQDLLGSVAFSALFGAAVGGGLGAIISRRSADDMATRFLAVHGAQEGADGVGGGEARGGAGSAWAARTGPGDAAPPSGARGDAGGAATPSAGGVRFGDFKPSPEAQAASEAQRRRGRGSSGETMEGPPVRLTDDEIAGHVDSFTPKPVERFVPDGKGGGVWVNDAPRPAVQDHVDGFVDWRELRDTAPMTAREAAEIDAMVNGRRTMDFDAANENRLVVMRRGGRADTEGRATSATDVPVREGSEGFDTTGEPARPANENVPEEVRRVVALLDEHARRVERGEAAVLRDTAANFNWNTRGRPESADPRVAWANERGQVGSDAVPQDAVNDNVAGAGRPAEPPPPAVAEPPGGDNGTVPPGGGGGGGGGEPPQIGRERPEPPDVPDKDRFAPGAGAEKITWAQMPFYVLMNNPLIGALGNAIARLAQEIVQMPGLRTKGAALGLSQETSSVEAMAHARWSARYVAADQAHNEAYWRYRRWNPDNAGPFTARVVQLKEAAVDLAQRGRRGAEMSIAEFDMEVMKALEDPSAVAIKEVREAAEAWRSKLLDPMAEEAAAAGVLLTPTHAAAARQALERQLGTIGTIEARINAMGLAKDDRLRGQMRAWREAVEGRMQALDEMAGEDRLPYVPHVHMERAIKENRAGFERTLIDWWTSGRARRPLSQWATPEIRAAIATSHVLNAGAGDALEAAIRAHLVSGGMTPELAAARAAELAAPTKAQLEAARPPQWKREVNALLNRFNEEPDGYAFLWPNVQRALVEAGIEPEVKLVREIAPAERMGARERALPGFARERTIDAPISVLGDFLDLNVRSVMADYTRNMGAAVEMSRKFGDPSMQARLAGLELDILAAGADAATLDKLLQATRDLRDKTLGRFSAPENADAWSVRTVRLLQSHAILTQMGRSVFSAVTDAGRVVMEHGFRPVAEGVWQGIIDREGFKLAAQEAKLAGAATELVLLGRSKSLYDLQSSGADRSLVERLAHGGVETMMFVNLLAPWTQLAQEFAGVLTQHTIADLSLRIAAGRASADEIARMASIGIDAPMAERIAWQYVSAGAHQRQGTGLRLLNTEGWQDRALVDQVRAAIRTSIDSQVIKPGIADRPNFLSAPLAQGIFMYKSFAIASTQRTLMAGLQRRDALVVSGMLASVAIAYAFADPPGGDKDRNPIFNSARLSQAIEKSGVLGIVTDLNNAMEVMSGHNLGVRPLLGLDPPLYAKRNSWADQLGAALGPAVSPWLNLTWALTDPEAKSDEAAGAVRRIIPFNNLLWINGVSRALSREVGTFMHTPAER